MYRYRVCERTGDTPVHGGSNTDTDRTDWGSRAVNVPSGRTGNYADRATGLFRDETGQVIGCWSSGSRHGAVIPLGLSGRMVAAALAAGMQCVVWKAPGRLVAG